MIWIIFYEHIYRFHIETMILFAENYGRNYRGKLEKNLTARLSCRVSSFFRNKSSPYSVVSSIIWQRYIWIFIFKCKHCFGFEIMTSFDKNCRENEVAKWAIMWLFWRKHVAFPILLRTILWLVGDSSINKSNST